MMIERQEKRFVNCPVCGRILMKCQGVCNIEIACSKCGRDIVVIIEDEKVSVLENRRNSKNTRSGEVRVSVAKKKTSKCMMPMKQAVSY